MDYPDHGTYRKLYARYFQGERTKELLDYAGDLNGKNVIDLCGGGGRLAIQATVRGGRVTVIDESKMMLGDVRNYAYVINSRVQDWLTVAPSQTNDVIFCQQAVNYWLTPCTARQVATTLKYGGKFIFNTFNKKPPAYPMVKQYELEGGRYVELSWLVGDDVHHVQICEDMSPHITTFLWISPEEFHAWLSYGFEVKEHRDGATSIYVCTKK